MKDSLGTSSVSKETDGDLVSLQPFAGKGGAGRNGDVAGYDGKPAEHSFAEHVHGPAASLCIAGRASVQLSEKRTRGLSKEQGEGVASICGAPPVVGSDGADGGRLDGLLADVEVEESADLPMLVPRLGPKLEVPDAKHLMKKLEKNGR